MRGLSTALCLTLVLAVACSAPAEKTDDPAGRPSIKVLAIDGGGARGIIPAMVLARIEECTARPIHETFDVIAGTSTGSLIAAMLTVPRPDADAIRRAESVVSYYEGEGAKLFFERTPEYAERAATWEVPSYPASSHVNGIQAAISSQTSLSEAATNLVVTAYNLSEDPPRTYSFTRRKARHGDPEDGSPAADHEFRVWEVIRGASTFPGIWPGATLVAASGKQYYPLDGGVFAINPALEGLTHSLELLRDAGGDGDQREFLVLSLGTGYYNQTDLVGTQTQDWGPLQWYRQGAVPHLVGVLFEGQTDSVGGLMEAIHDESGALRHYFRFQPEMEHDFQLDDVDPKSIETLKGYARTMIDSRAEEIEGLCRLLEEGKGLPDS